MPPVLSPNTLIDPDEVKTGSVALVVKSMLAVWRVETD
jgi:hypothetical protein